MGLKNKNARYEEIKQNVEDEIARAYSKPDPILKDFKFVMFEGGDFSGKTTQARELASRYDKCMIVHFPRTAKFHQDTQHYKDQDLYHISNATKAVYEETSNILYNNSFWLEYTYEMEKANKFTKIEYYKDTEAGRAFAKLDNKLRECLRNNIINNAVDKLSFFVDLKNFLLCETKCINYNLDYTFYINGKEVCDKDKIKEVIKSYKYDSDKERVIIFDRFILSGKIYNSYIPRLQIMTQFLKHFNCYNFKNPITLDEMIKLVKNYTRVQTNVPAKNEFNKYCRSLFEDYYQQFIYMCDLLSDVSRVQDIFDTKLIRYLNKLTDFTVRYTSDLPAHDIKETIHSIHTFIKDFDNIDDVQLQLFDSYSYFNTHYGAFRSNTLNHNFINVNCYRSQKLFENIKKDAENRCRKIDEYDKNTFMQTMVNRYFDECNKASKDLSSPVQNVDVFKMDEKFRESLYLNTLNIDSDKYYGGDNNDQTFNKKETMIHNIAEAINIMVNDYDPQTDPDLVCYYKSRDDIRYMNY